MLNDHNFKCNFSTLTVFTFSFRNKTPQNLNHVQSPTRQWRARALTGRTCAAPHTLGLRRPCQGGRCLLPQDLRTSLAGEPFLPSAWLTFPSSLALGRGDQPLTRARSALLSISDAFVLGGWDCFPCCQWENRDDFTPIFGKDSLWKTNYNADCHFN